MQQFRRPRPSAKQRGTPTSRDTLQLRISERAWVSRYKTVAQTVRKIQKTQTLSASRRASPTLPFRSHQARPPCQPSCSHVVCVSARHDGTCSCGLGDDEGRTRWYLALQKSSTNTCESGGWRELWKSQAHVTLCDLSFSGHFSGCSD